MEGNTKGAILVVTYGRWHTTTYIGVGNNALNRVESFMARNIFAIIIICTLTGCRDDFNLTLRFENAGGLSTYTQVTLNGLIIGHVSNVQLDSDHTILVELNLDKLKQIPTDTKFILRTDLLGGGSIDLELGSNSEFIQNGETINGIIAEIDNDGNNIVNELLNFGKKSTQDSILFELRRLNENLEKLINKD